MVLGDSAFSRILLQFCRLAKRIQSNAVSCHAARVLSLRDRLLVSVTRCMNLSKSEDESGVIIGPTSGHSTIDPYTSKHTGPGG